MHTPGGGVASSELPALAELPVTTVRSDFSASSWMLYGLRMKSLAVCIVDFVRVSSEPSPVTKKIGVPLCCSIARICSASSKPSSSGR